MGHTGIAMKLGAESMYFNPAGMAYMDKTIDLSGSITGIMAHCTATIDGKDYKTDNDVATPLGVHAAFSIYDNLKAGVSLYTPYGSSINWGENWPGAVLNQNVQLKVFTIQPTFAWAITPKLSIGAGAMVSWGSVDLNKALVSASSTDRAIGLLKMAGKLPADFPAFGETSPASVNLNGTADVTVGINVGALYNINEKVSVGASYRSKMNMKVGKGMASVKYANSTTQQLLGTSLDLINNANFKAQMPCPWVLGLGVAYRPIKPLTIAFDARLTGWNAYKQLDIEFLAEQLTPYNQNIEKNYKNAWCFSVGAEYAVTSRFDARVGFMLDTTPVQADFYNPETPGMTKYEPTLGLSFRPIESLSIDFSFMYVAGAGRKNTSCTYKDMIYNSVVGEFMGQGLTAEAAAAQAAAAGFTPTSTIRGDYKLHAFVPSLGISYRF